MLVKELIKKLELMPSEAEVVLLDDMIDIDDVEYDEEEDVVVIS